MTRCLFAAAGLLLALAPAHAQALKEFRVLRDLDGPVNVLAFSPDGKTLAADEHKNVFVGRVRLWDAATGQETAKLEPGVFSVHCLAFSPDGKWLAVSGDAGPPMGSAPSRVVLWDLAAGKAGKSFHEPLVPIGGLAFQDGSRVLATGGFHVLRTWDVVQGKKLLEFQQKDDKLGGFGAVRGVFKSLAFAPGGKVLATGGHEHGLRLWDVDAGKELARLGDAGSWAKAVAFTPDGKTLVSAGGGKLNQPELKLWDVATRKERADLKGHTEYLTAAAFSSDGRWLATASADGTVRLWDPAAAVERFVLRGHTGAVLCLAISPDGQTLATGGQDKTVRLWSLPAAK